MELFKTILEQNREEKAIGIVTAVIAAAGKSERMGNGINKQFIPLCDIPILARTISAFQACRVISQIVIVARPEDILEVAGIVREFGFDKVVKIVPGGETRQKSVASGFSAVKDADYIAVHDGARPLITGECITRVVRAAVEHGAAAAAVRVKDTIKRTDENGDVVETPDRGRFWMVQTPQAFSMKVFKDALKTAMDSGCDYTDDCQLIEAVGGKIRLVEGDYSNFKITTKEDVARAEILIRAKEGKF